METLKKNPLVVRIKQKDYGQTELDQAIEKLLAPLELPPISGKKWLLKPNVLTSARPEEAVTTHPHFLRSVIRWFVRRGGMVGVGDSPALGGSAAASPKTGLRRAAEEEGAQVVNFKETRRRTDFGGVLVKQFDIARELDNWDYLVSLPKMKNHQMMYFTGAMKNIFGVIPGLAKSQYHFRFPEKDDFARMIVDLNRAVPADLAIMDGILSMEGPGPGSGTPRNTGILLASANPLSLDAEAERLVGYDPEELPITAIGCREGLWGTPKGDPPSAGTPRTELRIPDFKRITVLKDTGFIRRRLPPGLYRFLKNLYLPRPRFHSDRCIQCGQCAAICPVDAITLSPLKADYSLCIRCYCCHEVCPAEAITVSRRART